MRLFARLSMFAGFLTLCLGVVGAIVYLEVDTDVIGDIRVAVGIDEGRISQNSLPFDEHGTLVERVSNWRAYSGPSRHLPAAEPGWRRTEIDASFDSLDAFRRANEPALVATKAAPDIGLLSQSPTHEWEGGLVNLQAAGVTGGAAMYTSGTHSFFAVLQRVPTDLSAVIEPATGYMTEAEMQRAGISEKAIGGRVFRYTATGIGDGAYLSLTGRIGQLYLLTIEGTAPMAAIAAHVGRIDFRRLEEEASADMDPMARLSVFGDVLMKANGLD